MAAAPMLGGLLNDHYGFRSNFIAIFVTVLLSFVLCLLYLKETLPVEKRQPLKIGPIFQGYRKALTCWPFMQLNLLVGVLFAVYMSFVSTISVFFPLELGVSKTFFPLYQGSIIGSYVVGSLSFDRIVSKIGVPKIKAMGFILLAVSATVLPLAQWIAPQNAELLTVSMVPFGIGCSWLMVLYSGEVMNLLPEIKGTVAALLNSLRLLITSSLIGLNASLYDKSLFWTVAFSVGMSVLVLCLAYFYERKTKVS